ncbi:polyprenyl synthetase family protein [Terriglobus sp.]|uniref:polyprenyl synthetase family protein n=1 Tax=Terriglobus sp. TaxID=1889013 RepID=UPI003AFF7C66
MSTAVPGLALEAELCDQVACLTGKLRAVCEHALQGGRRIRSLLLLGCAEVCSDRAILAAVSVEMLHAATLLQDDIFDAGILRRGRPASHVKFGKASTILASDWLLIRALELASEVDIRFFRALSAAARSMVQAEAQELVPTVCDSMEAAERQGCSIANGKTGALFGAAVLGAAVLRDMPADTMRQWHAFGTSAGWTYQLIDDCIDLYQPEIIAGKDVGHDLPAGCMTVPVLLGISWLRQCGHEVSLEDLQRSENSYKLEQLREAVSSSNVRLQTQRIIAERFAAHERRARLYGLPQAAISGFIAHLQQHVSRCFPKQSKSASSLAPMLEPDCLRPRT